MSPEQERLIRQSWAALQPHEDAVARRFYAYLFEADPDVEAKFGNTDMDQQRIKFMAMLAEIVAVLDDPQRLIGDVAGMGRRHARLDLTARDYDLVGAALLRALESELGESFTAEVKECWRELYRMVAAVMQRAAQREHEAGVSSATMPQIGQA